MVVEEKEEVIGNKILARAPQINWIPVLKLFPELVELILCNSEFGLVIYASLCKNVVPHVQSELLRPEISTVSVLCIHYILLI